MKAVNHQRLVEDLRELGARFKRLANRENESTAGLNNAAAWGGKLLVELSEANLLPFALPSPPPPKTPSEDVESPWECIWFAAVVMLSHGLPRHFPSNPHLVRWQRPEPAGAEQVALGTIAKRDWRDRAENYAYVCEVLAKDAESQIQAPTADEPHRDRTIKSHEEITAEYRDGGLAHGEPLTVALISRPEKYNLSGSYLARNYKGPRLKLAKEYIYRHAEIAALSDRKTSGKL